MRQPTLPNRKRSQFVRCPVCGADFHRQIPGQRWCSRTCAQREKRLAGGFPSKRLIAAKDKA
jgi:hypothetical protein